MKACADAVSVVPAERFCSCGTPFISEFRFTVPLAADYFE